jgi:hypothetical protein
VAAAVVASAPAGRATKTDRAAPSSAEGTQGLYHRCRRYRRRPLRRHDRAAAGDPGRVPRVREIREGRPRGVLEGVGSLSHSFCGSTNHSQWIIVTLRLSACGNQGLDKRTKLLGEKAKREDWERPHRVGGAARELPRCGERTARCVELHRQRRSCGATRPNVSYEHPKIAARHPRLGRSTYRGQIYLAYCTQEPTYVL